MARDLSPVKVLLLSTQDLKKVLDMNDVLSAVENAFRLKGLGRVQMPPKMYLYYERYNGDLRCMPSYIEDMDVSAVKIVNVHPDNPGKHGLRTVMATILLIDPATGAPLAIMDGSHITDMRTGAASGVATKYLARKESRSVGIIGAGIQARMQLLAILTALGTLEEVRVYDIDPEASKRLVEEESKKYAKRIHSLTAVDEARLAVSGTDIVVTCTTSRKPIVMNSWVSKGQHFNCIGADAPGKQELESSIVRRGKVVIDDWEQACHSGEINVPISEKVFSKKDIYGNLGDIVAGKLPGRASVDEITLFTSTGLAIQDATTASLGYMFAKKRGLGHEFEMIQA